MIRHLLTGTLLPILLGVLSPPCLAASIAVGQAGSGGVTVVLAPDSTDVGIRTNVYMGAVWNGLLFLRSGGTGNEVGEWHLYPGGALPIAVANLTLSASQTIPVVNFDLSSLPGLQLYVGYGNSEGDLYLPGHLALIHTVPTSPSTFQITIQDVSGTCALDKTSQTGVLVPTGQADTYTTEIVPGAVITLTVPGSNTVDFSFPDNGGISVEHAQLTFDAQSRTIAGTTRWTHTNGCSGYSTISGSW